MADPASAAVVGTTVLVASAILGFLAPAMGVTANILKTIYGKQIDKVAKKIAPLLNQNLELRSQISNALQEHNSKLAGDLLMASPLSSIVSKLRKKIEVMEEGRNKSEQYFKDQEEKMNEIQKEVTNYENSFASQDLVAAADAAVQLDKGGRESLNNRTEALKKEQDRIKKELLEAKAKASTPQLNSSLQPGAANNIGNLDRNTDKVGVPKLQMKGNSNV